MKFNPEQTRARLRQEREAGNMDELRNIVTPPLHRQVIDGWIGGSRQMGRLWVLIWALHFELKDLKASKI